MIGPGQREPGLRHALPEPRGVVPEAGAQGVAIFDQLEHLQGRGGDHRGQRVGKQIGPRALTQPVDDLAPCPPCSRPTPRPAPCRACRSECRCAPRRRSIPATRARDRRETRSRGSRPPSPSRRISRPDRRCRRVGDDPVHREHAVRGDQPEARALGLLQFLFQSRHVVVGVAIPLRLRQPHPVDDRGVVQRIGNDRVFRPQQRLEQPAIGVETRGVEDRVLHPQRTTRCGASSALCSSCVPQMKRTEAMPNP